MNANCNHINGLFRSLCGKRKYLDGRSASFKKSPRGRELRAIHSEVYDALMLLRKVNSDGRL